MKGWANRSTIFSKRGGTEKGSKGESTRQCTSPIKQPLQGPPEDYFSYFPPGAQKDDKGTKEKARCLGNLISIFKVIDKDKYPVVSPLEVDGNAGEAVEVKYDKIRFQTLKECIDNLIKRLGKPKKYSLADKGGNDNINFFRSLKQSLETVKRIINSPCVQSFPAVLSVVSSNQEALHNALPPLLKLLKIIDPAAPLQEDEDSHYDRSIIIEMKHNAKYLMLAGSTGIEDASCINRTLIALCKVAQQFNNAWDLPVIIEGHSSLCSSAPLPTKELKVSATTLRKDFKPNDNSVEGGVFRFEF
jgi:hypothetical protein